MNESKQLEAIEVRRERYRECARAWLDDKPPVSEDAVILKMVTIISRT